MNGVFVMSKLSWFLNLAVAMVLLSGGLLTAGCQAPDDKPVMTAQQVIDMPLEKNVVGVVAYYPSANPWIWTENRSRARGIVINALYLEGPNVSGVFGDGVIRPQLYVLDRSRGKRIEPVLVKEWSFDPRQAMPFRSKKRTIMGHGYRFHLIWGDDFDLTGKDIRVVVIFERVDGKIIHSGKKDFRVPKGES